MANEGSVSNGIGSDEPIKWRHDVFLCFRGEDTRHCFTGNLYDALRQARFRTFMDDGELKGGDQISSTLLQALQASRISIVVLSRHFAHSTWCLDDLVKILECKNIKNQVVLPIFYKVDPSDIRNQRNDYRDALHRHEERFKKDSDKVSKWALALSEIASLRGFHFQEGGCEYEFQFIENIVDWVTKTVQRYDVFLSFSGEDTRYTFTGYLYNALRRGGFKTFMNDGDHLSQSITEAIEKSRLSIIVFSEKYAYSSSCLDELVTILECMKMKNQLVWPIFYKVEPSDLRHQRNSYGEAMTKHENELGKDSEEVHKWRSALFEVANLKGWHLKTGYEYEFIDKIVEMAIKI
ncbi:probable disease resistance protein RPP1 [Abrus precatorius]|uniref:Probable disease resistance protein RPP1 n=1 Tax=Abrus precatorius TaxID=3816 RepID=A0A8B8JNV8_ABRPR|nr:probable disease resistance protein RPP1 [Abrus precatorius]